MLIPKNNLFFFLSLTSLNIIFVSLLILVLEDVLQWVPFPFEIVKGAVFLSNFFFNFH